MTINKCVIVVGFLVLADVSLATSKERNSQLSLGGNSHDHPQTGNSHDRPKRPDVAQEESYTIPVTNKAGVQYYDLAQADRTEVVLNKAQEGVWGVTAGSGKCMVQTLVLSESFVMDHVVASRCPLSNVTIRGFLKCYRILDWVKLLPDVVHFHDVECLDIRCHNPNDDQEENEDFFKLSEIQDNSDVLNIKCPEICNGCTTYVYNGGISVTVKCHEANLTAADLPELPSDTSTLMLDKNRIGSTELLIEHLKGYHKLKRLVVSENHMTTIPYLPMDTLGHLKSIDLSDNNITQLDVKATELLFTRKGLQMNLNGNPLHCGCHLYHVNQLYLKYCGDEGEYPCINSYMKLKCFSASANRTVPIYKMNYLEGCHEEPYHFNYWYMILIILILLTLLMAWLITDISLILLNFNGTRYLKRPKMDYIVCCFTNLAEMIRSVARQQRGDQTTGHMGAVDLRENSIYATRSQRYSISNWRTSQYLGQ